MKRNYFSIRAFTAIGALCGAIMIPSISHATGALLVNGSATPCVLNATIQLTPAGDFNVVCSSSTVPVCTISASATAISAGGTSMLTANCSPAAVTYAWTGGPPTMSGQSATLTFPIVGSFTYSVTGTNSTGPGLASPGATISVSPLGAPVCSVSATPSSINATGTSLIQATCNPAAVSLAWTVTNSGPAMSGTSATLTFPLAGLFSYSVIGTNATAAGAPSAAVPVTVNAAGTCVAKAVNGPFTGSIMRSVAIDSGNSVTFSLPVYTTAGKTLEILSSQTTNTQQGLHAEFSVSSCPGDFTTMQADCKSFGGVEMAGTQLYASTQTARLVGTCTVIENQQYYLNVRNIAFDRVTSDCLQQTCYMNVHLNTY